MEYTVEPSLSKELILGKVTEETLLEHYLGVRISKKLVKSPLRNDARPTMGFFRDKKGNILCKDFANGFCGNWISVVMYKFNCSYGKALQIVANDFGIITKKNLEINKPLIRYSNKEFIDEGGSTIQVEIKPFSEKELQWWEKYGITEKILKKFKVFSCKNVFLNGNLFHLYKENQLVFGYYGGTLDEVENWRIYQPKNQKCKFISNWKSNRLQGGPQLPKEGGDYVIVSKAMKDVMTLYSLRIPAVAPISENCFLTDSQYNKLKAKFKKIFIAYDNDLPGVRAMSKIKKQYPDIQAIIIPKKYGCKDISDFYKKYGREKTERIIEEAKAHYCTKGTEEEESEQE